MCDIRVSFAFLTPSSLRCSFSGDAGIAESVGAPRDSTKGDDYVTGRVVPVKVIDFEAGCSRVIRVSLHQNAVMSDLYDALRGDKVCRGADCVCFELACVDARAGGRLAISNILSIDDVIPTVVFAQLVRPSLRLAFVRPRWVAVNIFACDVDGRIAVAHVPFAVPLLPEEASRDALLVSASRVLCLSPECEAQLRNCVLLACRFDGQGITVGEPLLDGYVGDQVAVMLNAVDIGDVVAVAAQWYQGASGGQVPIVQGAVARRFVQDGVTLFDVKELDTSLVIEKLSCVQLIPL